MTEAQQQVPSERDIFKYWDGTKNRYVDPLKIWNFMWNEDEDVQKEFARVAQNELEATTLMVQLARKWFDIPPYSCEEVDGADGVQLKHTGLTDLEICNVLRDYLQYTNELKKKLGPLPIPSRLLLPQFPGNPSPTKSDADSSSMPNASPEEEPTTTSMPSPAPSQEA